ncbi:hypothetical protein F5146DRAFT_1145974 [Armillaria mellea]|nr:hypothetical protein F5146DRAFT_1145974 [Armillaria mellea]
MSIENEDTVYTYTLVDSSRYPNNYTIVFVMLTTHSRKSESPASIEETTLDDTPFATASAEYTPEQYKKLKRKVDYYLLPLLWLCCRWLLHTTLRIPVYLLSDGLQDADRAVLSPMSVFRIREDTGLVGQQYSWLTTVYFIGYLCFEFPSNCLLQRWRMGKTLSIFMVANISPLPD